VDEAFEEGQDLHRAVELLKTMMMAPRKIFGSMKDEGGTSWLTHEISYCETKVVTTDR
jgi:hypothetical protein